jgi:hypothetical protein
MNSGCGSSVRAALLSAFLQLLLIISCYVIATFPAVYARLNMWQLLKEIVDVTITLDIKRRVSRVPVITSTTTITISELMLITLCEKLVVNRNSLRTIYAWYSE